MQTILFDFAYWHGLVKARIHTNTTLELEAKALETLSRSLQQFQKEICPAFQTRETPREVAARKRREAARDHTASGPSNAASSDGPHSKQFNLDTYKVHALGDYGRTIRLFGTTDGYCTRIVSKHRTPCSHH